MSLDVVLLQSLGWSTVVARAEALDDHPDHDPASAALLWSRALSWLAELDRA